MASLTGKYKPTRNPANNIYLWTPATSPLYKAVTPSSLTTVIVVPTSPLYFGGSINPDLRGFIKTSVFYKLICAVFV